MTGFDAFRKPSGPCQQCGLREATQLWLDNGSVLELAHGAGAFWCERCCVEAQLAHCRESASRIPDLEGKLERLDIAEAAKRS